MKKLLYTGLIVLLLLGVILPMSATLAKHPDPGHSVDNEAEYYLAAHAVVVNGCQEETAWADCNNSQQFNEGGSWAFYFTYPGNNFGDPQYIWNGWGLYAGQNTMIGYVYVDIVDIDASTKRATVRWLITEPGWEIIETHIALACTLDGIPQTNKGNPKVGQFAIGGVKTGETFSPGQTEIIREYDFQPCL